MKGLKIQRKDIKRGLQHRENKRQKAASERALMERQRTELEERYKSGHGGTYLALLEPSLYLGDVLPPDVLRFIHDPYFFGGMVTLQPEVERTLWDIRDPALREIDCQVGKGSGKSEIAKNSLGYGAMRILMMKEPQTFFGLSRDTEISLCNVSISGFQAKTVIFNGLRAKIEESPFFMSRRPIFRESGQFGTPEIRFPDRNLTIYCGHSGSTKFLGVGTIEAVVDEVNYLHTTPTKETAQEMYAMLGGSMRTRFPYYYKLLNISSVTHDETWMYRRFKQGKSAGQPYRSRMRVMRLKELTEIDSKGCQWVEIVCDQNDSQDRESVEKAVRENMAGAALLDVGVWDDSQELPSVQAYVQRGQPLLG